MLSLVNDRVIDVRIALAKVLKAHFNSYGKFIL